MEDHSVGQEGKTMDEVYHLHREFFSWGKSVFPFYCV